VASVASDCVGGDGLALVTRLVWVPAFFTLRIGSALVLLKLSASLLPVSGFAIFCQLMLFAALLNVLALIGVQNGVVRQAAAAQDHAALLRTQSAAFAIWLAALPLVLVPALLGRDRISQVLVGSAAQGPMVAAITVTVLLGAPGAIWCALLTGRKRMAPSLSCQAVGLVVGALAAAWRIAAHDPAGAALAFAAGSLATGCVALPCALRLGLPLIPHRWTWAPIKTLLRYSAAMAATTGYAAAAAFGQRWIYREHFGVAHLGYWLSANRVSDMSTQLIGLYLIQVFVPHLAMTRDPDRRRAFLVRCWAAAAGVMTCFLAVFCLASGPLIHLFLSDAYRPAAPIIRSYMIGDVLRVWLSLAMHAAFAKGRPLRYAAMDMGALTVMAGLAVVLIAAGDPAAPQIGYVTAYALAAVTVSAVFLFGKPAGNNSDDTI
jgi:O-antigen/teichoic acid export membrane protein